MRKPDLHRSISKARQRSTICIRVGRDPSICRPGRTGASVFLALRMLLSEFHAPTRFQRPINLPTRSRRSANRDFQPPARPRPVSNVAAPWEMRKPLSPTDLRMFFRSGATVRPWIDVIRERLGNLCVSGVLALLLLLNRQLRAKPGRLSLALCSLLFWWVCRSLERSTNAGAVEETQEPVCRCNCQILDSGHEGAGTTRFVREICR